MARIDTEELLSKTDIASVIDKYVSLKKRGPHLYGICPFHNDTSASLTVTPNKGIYKCFPCGAGGDALDFLMRMGRTFHEAVDELQNGGVALINPEQRSAKAAKPNSWRHVTPAPVQPTSFRHYKFGEAAARWVYRNAEGKAIGYVCRFETADGKQVLPYVYATDGSRSEWRFMGFNKPRPLYNLHLLAQNPNATALVVEGEKTADAAQAELDPAKTVVVTWIGGADGINTADWTPLHGRKVVYWRDNDEPGRKAMLIINEALKPHCQTRKWVNIPDSYPAKWDAADKQWQPNELRQFILDNLSDVPAYTPEPTPPPAAPTPPPPPENPPLPPEPVRTVADWTANPHYRMLGYDKDENSRLVYYFFSFDAKAVVKLSPSSMTKANLLMLAPLNYWEEQFPKSKGGIDVDAAAQFLMLNSHKVGIFKDLNIRGRGTWVDEGRIVIHTGDYLIVDRDIVPLNAIRSRFVYEIGEPLRFGTSQPLQAAEARKLIEFAKWLNWEREINAYLLAGWCVIAPFCGVLQWRPHIWLTGPAGSGKSWTMDNFIKRLLGDTCLPVNGKTTEAGVRALLQLDARPVIFDESDVDSYNDKERIQNILALARSSSYHDGGVIAKGTQSGASRTYTIRSCFAFSSIGVHVNQQSDRSRFTMLGLVSFEGKRTQDDFEHYSHEWNSTVTPEYVDALHSRTIGLLTVILKNARTFADAVAATIGQRRIGDQVGALLAGAYSLSSSKEITYDEAVAWVKERDWTDERGLELTKDEFQLFSKLMGSITKIETDHGTKERTIGELVNIAVNIKDEYGYSPQSARDRLKRLGFDIRDGRLLISNAAEGIKAIIERTAWSSNYNKVLERLPGALKVEPRTYAPGSGKARGVSVPLDMVIDKSLQVELTLPPQDEEPPF